MEDLTTPGLVEVQARPRYHLWLSYDEGTEGEVDLAAMVGRGVFKAWQDVSFFESVRIAPHGALVWADNIDLCPDAMYLRLTDLPFASVRSARRSPSRRLRRGLAHASVIRRVVPRDNP